MSKYVVMVIDLKIIEVFNQTIHALINFWANNTERSIFKMLIASRKFTSKQDGYFNWSRSCNVHYHSSVRRVSRITGTRRCRRSQCRDRPRNYESKFQIKSSYSILQYLQKYSIVF